MEQTSNLKGAAAQTLVKYITGEECSRKFSNFIAEYLNNRALLGPRLRASTYRLAGAVVSSEYIANDISNINDGGHISYWGCGAQNDDPINQDLLERCDFHGARGPLTRDILGLPSNVSIGDPGLLMPLLRPPVDIEERHGKTVCIPGRQEKKSDGELLSMTGADLIIWPNIGDSIEEFEKIVDSITGADFVLSGSLYAAILANAYDVPFAFFESGFATSPFTWRDFAASIDIPPMFARSVDEGLKLYKEFIQPKKRRLPLIPIIESCPFYVRASVILKAIEHDSRRKIDPALLYSVKLSKMETRAYIQAASDSESRRDNRLKMAIDSLLEEKSALLVRLEKAEASYKSLDDSIADLAVERDLLLKTIAQLNERIASSEADVVRLVAQQNKLQQQQGALDQLKVERDTLMKTIAQLTERVASSESDVAALLSEQNRLREVMGQLAEREERAREDAARLLAERNDLNLEMAKIGRREASLEVKLAALGTEASARSRHARELQDQVDALSKKRIDLQLELESSRAEQIRSQTSSEHWRSQHEGLSIEAEQLRIRAIEGALHQRISEGDGRSGAKLGALTNWRLSRLLSHARLAARARDWGAAERCYAKILQVRRDQPRIWVQYGHALKEQGLMEVAVMAYRQADLLEPNNPDTREHYQFAIERCGLALKASEPSGETFNPTRRRGELWSGLDPRLMIRLRSAQRAARARQWTIAAEKYRLVIRRAPSNARFWVQLGHAVKEGGDVQAAEAAYRRALMLAPSSADAHLQYGHLQKLLGRPDQAEPAYRQAFQLAPSNTSARAELESLGMAPAELVGLVITAEKRPTPEAQLPWRGLLLLRRARKAARLKDWKRAETIYQRIVRMTPTVARVWIQLGHAFKEQGELRSAEGAYLQAIALAPDSADAHLQLGHVLKMQGRGDEALQAYLRAYYMNPGLRSVRQELSDHEAELASLRAGGLKLSIKPEITLLEANEQSAESAADTIEDSPGPPGADVVKRRLGLTDRQVATWLNLQATVAASIEE